MKEIFAHGVLQVHCFFMASIYPFKNDNEILESPWKILVKFHAKRNKTKTN